MSKKHFIALADVIKMHNAHCKPEEKFSQTQIEQLATFCKFQNFQFNRERWLGYIAGECGPNGGTR